MRRILIVLGIVALLLVAAIGIFIATFDPNAYRGTIQTKLEQQLSRKVSLGNINLRLFPLRFSVATLSIADDPKFNSKHAFVQTDELSVSVKLLPLLSKSVQVDSLTLKRPSVELVRNEQGMWNFASLGQNPQTSTPSSGQQQFSLGELAIEDGQVAITDLQGRKPRAVYDHINLKLADYAPNTPFNLEASVHLPGGGTQEVRVEGKGGPLSHFSLAVTPFQGTLDLKNVQLAGLQKFLQTADLANTDGVLSGHTNIASQNGKLSANGQMNLDKPRLHGVDVGFPINVDYEISDDVANDLLKITKGAIKVGFTPLSVTGTVDSKTAPAQLDLSVKANDISIAEIARLAAATGTTFSSNTTVNGRVNANIQARGSADKPVLTGTLDGRDIHISGKDVPTPVQVKTVNVALTPTEIRTDNFNVTSGGTAAAVQFTLKQYVAKNPLVEATLRAPQATLPELLSMAKAYGVTGLDKLSGAGNLSLDMHAAGPLEALSGDQITKLLNGNINVNFNNVRYAGVDISHQLASLAGFTQAGEKDQGFTNILKMTGNILVKNGIAQTDNLQAVLDIVNVGASGTANLTSQALNMQVNAVFSKAFSQHVNGASVVGNNVGAYMNAALSNSQGELVIPALVTGTFQNPRFVPDTKKMAQMKLKGIMPTEDNPLGGASSILGQLIKQKGQPAQGQQQPQPSQDTVDQLLNLFGGKKKPPR